MDPLSDLPGTEEFAQLLAREELRRGRTNESLAVAVVDLDGLGAVNKIHGATVGTHLLRTCAEVLHQTLRGVDEVARTGPDEFSVLLHATDAEKAAVWEERFEDMLDACGRNLPAAPVTCSIGIADSAEAPTLMEVAVRARRRMEVIQTVRKLRRARETGSS
ncbi:MAG: diguanylate cyclase [Thermoleophilaceae bacterium]|jgi:diguanylate cyclase (GGDEF)-like protein|nr:diguanylate cyclase [Thermoleophilaceae bacterium]